MKTPVAWFPELVYLKDELVVDDELDFPINEKRRSPHTEPGGVFRCLHDLRSGLLNPRYQAVDFPGRSFERVATITAGTEPR